jgi:DNA ligase-1
VSCPLATLVATWQAVRAAPGRLEKRRLMAGLFARLEPEDARRAATWLAGELHESATGVGWALLSEARARATTPAGDGLTLADVDACLRALAAAEGPGANRARIEALAAILARAGAAERELLAGLLMGELRQGALRALVLEALAQARGWDAGELRRAVMHAGSLAEVVEAAARDGEAALARFTITPLRALEPMLAATAGEPEAALVDLGGEAAVEHKLDGIRIQVHRLDDEVRVFTRGLHDVTATVPGLAARARGLAARSFILDGELLGAEPYFFDLLYLDGQALLERPDRERRAALERLVGEARCTPRRIVRDAAGLEAALAEALAHGHEGLMIKAIDAPYVAGKRSGYWRKLKTAHTLDLVILGAEWGHGRRRGWLSNLHLGARDAADPERFWMLGKTFKGLTDAMLRELTEDLPRLALESGPHAVLVRPERVVEIAFDSVERSARYDSGLALRFARVKRFRPDKRAADATTLDEIRAVVGKRKT